MKNTIKTLLCSTLLVSVLSPGTAFAKLEDNLAPLPADTIGLMSVNLSLQKWNTLAKQKFVQDAIKELMDESKKLESKTNINLFDVLLSVGSHASIGFYPRSVESYDALFSFNIKSRHHAQKVLNQIKDQIGEENMKSVKESTFGGYTLYNWNVELDEKFKSVHLAVGKNNILASFGKDDRMLKNMLYIEEVIRGKSRAKLVSKPLFKKASSHMEDNGLWFYIDMYKAASIFQDAIEDEEFKGLFAQSSYKFSQVMSFGMDLKDDGFYFNSYIGNDTNLLNAKEKKYSEAMSAPSKKSLSPIVRAMGKNPVMYALGDKLDVPLKNPDILMDSLKSSSPEMGKVFDEFGKEFVKGVKEMANIDIQKDFVDHLDGRYGFSVYMPEKKGTYLPDMVMFLGLKDKTGQNLTEVFRNKLKFNGSELGDELFGDFSNAQNRAKNSSVKANVHTLQTIVETFGVDWGGTYPENLEELMKEANKGNAYWRDFKNPATGKSGLGHSIKNFSDFSKDAKHLGTVFYEPVGEAIKTDGKKHFLKYKVSGYGFDGKLFTLSNYNAKSPALTGLPTKQSSKDSEGVTFSSTPTVTHLGVPIYEMKQKDLFKEIEELGKLAPAFAQYEDLFIISSNVDAVKSAIEYAKNKKPNLKSSSMYKSLAHKTKATPNGSFFALDTQQLIKRSFQMMAMDQTKEGKAWLNVLEPIGAMAASNNTMNADSTGTFLMEMDINRMDFDKIFKMIDGEAGMGSDSALEKAVTSKETASASYPYDLAKISSVKANMHTLQTIVETYGVDWGGVYAENMSTLNKEATTSSHGLYWKENTNPMTSKGAKWSDWTIDYKSYKAGTEHAGKVIYAPVKENGYITFYQIYGADNKGQLIKDKGQTFFLSNS